MRPRLRPALVICLAMVLVVGLIGGLSALAAALVTPTWVLAVVFSVTQGPPPFRSRVPQPIGARSSVGLRAPPPSVGVLSL